MRDYSEKEIKKIEEYLKSKEEIFTFILGKRILAIILFYLGIISIFLWLGGSSYLSNVVQTRIDKNFAEKVDDECSYLALRNKITEIGDLAISTGDIKFYNKIKEYLNSKNPERILTAAKAELMKVESFFDSQYSDQIFPIEKVEYTQQDGKMVNGIQIPVKNLMEIYNKTDNFGMKTTIIDILEFHKEKDVPTILLDIASNTNNLRIRHVALRSFQILINNFFVNQFDLEKNQKLWEDNKENYIKSLKT